MHLHASPCTSRRLSGTRPSGANVRIRCAALREGVALRIPPAAQNLSLGRRDQSLVDLRCRCCHGIRGELSWLGCDVGTSGRRHRVFCSGHSFGNAANHDSKQYPARVNGQGWLWTASVKSAQRSGGRNALCVFRGPTVGFW